MVMMMLACIAVFGKKPVVNNPIGEWKTDAAGLPCFEYTGSVPFKATLANGDSVKLDPDPWFVLGNYQLTLFAHVSGRPDSSAPRPAGR